MKQNIFRGEILLINFGDGVGSVQKGIRPAIVLQNDTGNCYSPTTIVCPMTTTVKKTNFPTHVFISQRDNDVKADSVVLCEQIKAIDKTQIISKLGRLSSKLMMEIELKLLVGLGITKDSE